MTRKNGKLLLGMAALLAMGTAAWAQSDAVCSSVHRSDLDQARQTRKNGHPDAALKMAEAVLKDEPNNLRAHYTVGLAKMDLSATGGPGRAQLVKDGFAELTRVANGTDEVLRKQDMAARTCLKEQEVFSIMNTLAYYYSASKNLSQTEFYLKKSLEYDKLGLLNNDTRRKTLGNLGSFYYYVGNYGDAKTYLSQAVKAGNQNESLQKQLKSIKSLE